MSRPPERRYPLGPLVRHLGLADASISDIAVVLHVTDRCVVRWRTGGVPETSLDRVCTNVLSVHPCLIYDDWPEFDDDGGGEERAWAV